MQVSLPIAPLQPYTPKPTPFERVSCLQILRHSPRRYPERGPEPGTVLPGPGLWVSGCRRDSLLSAALAVYSIPILSSSSCHTRSGSGGRGASIGV